MTKTILIIENNDLNSKLFDDLLQANGHNTLKNKDGINAFVMAKKNYPDLILMGIKYPKISGFKIFEMMKSSNITRKIPIIAVTTLAMQGDERKILEYGFDAYIAKPMQISLLITTIHRLIG